MTFNKTVEGNITISPLFANKPVALQKEMCFDNLTAIQLSEFYKITVTDGDNSLSRIILIPTANLPEEREKLIVSSVIRDKNCFYQYVAFLLGDALTIGGGMFDDAVGNASSSTNQQVLLPALYEKMLKTAVEDPSKFEEIDYLLGAVANDGVVPERFEETYKIFRKAVGYRD